MSTTEPTRVVLVKPGDVLVIGRVQVDPDAVFEFGRTMEAMKEAIGLKQIVVCEDDVSIAAETPAREPQPQRKLVVLARSEDEAREYCRTTGIPRSRIIYAGSPASLLGLGDVDVVRVGNWKDHPQLREMEQILARNAAKYRRADASADYRPRDHDHDRCAELDDDQWAVRHGIVGP